MDAGRVLGKALEPLHGQALLLGLSGGMDSTVLLHATCAGRAQFASIRAVHVDHGLHSDSANWARQCHDTCQALGVELDSRRVLVLGRGQGLEAAAREARMAAFADALRGGESLVLAQHRDDQAETLLLRLLRGAGSQGMGAMRAERHFAAGRLARPLLDVPREVLLEYAIANSLSWLEDPSNLDLRHDRNHLRHVILPALRARWPQADQALATSARHASADALLLADEALRRLDAARLPGDPSALSVATLLALSPAWRAHVLRAWFAERGLAPAPARAHTRIDAELLGARRDSNPELRWRGGGLRRWRDGLHAIGRETATEGAWQRDWDGAGWLALPDGSRLGFEADGTDAASPAPASARCDALRRDFGLLQVQSRRGGERLRLPGRRHHHTLKHLLQANGMPPWRRAALPLLYAGDGELLAAGDGLVGARLHDWSRTRACALRWQRVD